MSAAPSPRAFDAMAYRRAIFELVRNPRDWKGPIAAAVPRHLVPDAVDAIRFYTANGLDAITVEEVGHAFIIRAPGYRQGPAGDH